MAKPLIDLHLHTYYSDGTFTPEQVAKAAEEMKLAAISLTDHDTIEGCDRLAKACDERNIEFKHQKKILKTKFKHKNDFCRT